MVPELTSQSWLLTTGEGTRESRRIASVGAKMARGPALFGAVTLSQDIVGGGLIAGQVFTLGPVSF
jgi:hypothetical protein